MNIFSQIYRLLTNSLMDIPRKDLVFLLGFMATGKSTYGKSVAKRLGWRFIDLDTQIERDSGKSIPDIFSQLGEAEFRKIERQMLEQEVSHSEVPTILSCGGGTPCYGDNMEWMNSQGFTLYIQTPYPILLGRLKEMRADRPMLNKYSEEELPIFIQDLLERRVPYYLQSNMVFQTANMSKEAVSRSIAEKISSRTSNLWK
ncbi:MAG: shikimate kinase [Bacteroidota bacterium]